MMPRILAGLLFALTGVGIGALAAGLVYALEYEAYAIIWRADPTISRIAAFAIDTHAHYAVVAALVIGLASGIFLAGVVVLLALHFTGALPWWRP